MKMACTGLKNHISGKTLFLEDIFSMSHPYQKMHKLKDCIFHLLNVITKSILQPNRRDMA